MIVVGVVYLNGTGFAKASSRNIIKILCNIGNAITIYEDYIKGKNLFSTEFNEKLFTDIDTTGYEDYVILDEKYISILGLTVDIIIYEELKYFQSMNYIEKIGEYNCNKIEIPYRSCKFTAYYELNRHICGQLKTNKEQIIIELEAKVESLTNQLSRLDDMEAKINVLNQPKSNESINQTLVAKVNELQAENEELKKKLQQIIDLAK